MAASHSLSFAGIRVPPRRKFRKFKVLSADAVVGLEERGKTDLVATKNERLECGEGRKKLGVLYEDGFGERSVKDYLEWAREIIRDDEGGPRWFCPLECGAPLKDSPLLFFLPGS